MANYKIAWSERKTTITGKVKIDATLVDEQGIKYDKVTIWGDYPGFSDLMTGHPVTGDLVAAKDPKYGPTLYPPKTQGWGGKAAGGSFKGSQAMKEVVAQKNENITGNMDRKDESIKKAGAQRDAVLIVTTFRAKSEYGLTEDEITDIKKDIREWYKYFLGLAEEPFN